MNKENICFMPAWEMKEKISNQELTSQEITEIIIERIEKLNPTINAYCKTTFDLAREMANNPTPEYKSTSVPIWLLPRYLSTILISFSV